MLPPDFLADPYPYYSRLRSEDPVHISRRGIWTLTRYDDVALVLRDPRFGRKAFAAAMGASSGDPADSGMVVSLLFQDPPDHTRLRALASEAFTPSLVPALRDRIQQAADGLLDRVRDAGAMDLIGDFAFPLPVYVISEILGIPAADREVFQQWALAIARGMDSPPDSAAFERNAAAQVEIAAYFRGLITERRRCPQTDLVTRLIAAEAAGARLTESELFDLCSLLFLTGHQTTINLIGNGMLALLRHPMELRRLRDDPGLLPGAVEELLRYDSPVQRTGRMANTAVEIGGKTIPKGAVVLAMLGAANHDPAKFPDPARLDITRRDNRHLSFGSGARFCLGAPLAPAALAEARRDLPGSVVAELHRGPRPAGIPSDLLSSESALSLRCCRAGRRAEERPPSRHLRGPLRTIYYFESLGVWKCSISLSLIVARMRSLPIFWSSS